MTPIRLLPATLEHTQFLFRLRTDPLTAWASVQPPPTWEEHKTWLARVLADPNRHLYIAARRGYETDTDGYWEGTVRLDRGVQSETQPNPSAEVSLTVSLHSRGHGLGGLILDAVESEAVRLGFTVLRAHIKPENTRSIRCFVKAGYASYDPAGAFWYKRLPVAVPA